MKVFVHIECESVATDPDVMVEVECDSAPRVGDLFYTPKEVTHDLERQARQTGDYEEWYYPRNAPFESRRLSFADAIYVNQVSWELSNDGVYRCHIELGGPQ